MAEPCRSARAACVVDTLRDAVHATEFTTGARAGLVALAITVVVGLVWWRLRPTASPLPIVGLAATAAAAYAVRDAVFLPDRVVLALSLLTVAGLVVDVFRLPVLYLLVAAIPGAIVLDSAPAPLEMRWVRLLVFATTVLGGVALASFDRRWARHGLGAPLVALWAAGVYMTVPDTEAALAVLGATLVVAIGAWPLRLGSFGACGALPMAGLIAWSSRFAGTGRPSSIVGAVACIGFIAVEPATRMLRRGGPGPIDVLARPERGQWWTLPAVVPVQLVLVFVAARVAGLGHRVDRAVAIVAAEGILALAVSLLVTSRYRQKDQSSTTKPTDL
ncbi:MAG: hypothetical protein ABIQ73_21630 [Acidimicrobiales bacterium]